MFFYEPNGNNKQKDFYFFYLPLVIVIIPMATKKTQSLKCEI